MTNFIERPRYQCALGGALSTAAAIPGVVPITHASVGCAGNFAWNQLGAAGLQVGSGSCWGLSIPGSNILEREVVFGGVDRLREEVRSTIELMKADLYVILTGCVADMIGDDIQAVASEFRDEGVPVIAVETGGFKGNSYVGYELLLKRIFTHYVERGHEKVAGRVNLFGIVPLMDVFWRGNIEGIRSTLKSLGLEVNSFFSPQDSLEAIRTSSAAGLNIVVSDVYGIEAAKVFEERHGTPYISVPFPAGPAATEEFIRIIAGRLSLDHAAVEDLIQEEKKNFYKYLEPLTDVYNDADLQRYAIVVGDSNYAPALTRFLSDDLGWIPELAVCTDSLEPDKQEAVSSRLNNLQSGLKPKLIFETNTAEIIGHFNRHWGVSSGQQYFNTFSPAFVAGSSLDRELAASLGAAHLSISYPVANRAVLDRSYTGFRGGLHLIEDIIDAMVAGR